MSLAKSPKAKNDAVISVAVVTEAVVYFQYASNLWVTRCSTGGMTM